MPPAPQSRGGRRIGPLSGRNSARALLAEDNAKGGRTVRPQALALLTGVALPMRDRSFAPPAVADAAAAAAAYAGHLAGWTCMDANDLASAQKLMTAALAVAKESGDPVVAAGLLTDLAHMEHLAGSARDGVLAAQAAQSLGPRLPAAMASRAAAIEARCHARLGDVQATRAAMGRAEDLLERGSCSDPHPLDFFFNYGQLHHELHVAVRDLVLAGKAKPGTIFEHARLIGAAPHMGRRAALVNADAAIAHLLDADLEAGTAAADAAIRAAAPLKHGSARVLGALQRVRQPLSAYRGSAAIELDARLRAAAPRRLAVV